MTNGQETGDFVDSSQGDMLPSVVVEQASLSPEQFRIHRKAERTLMWNAIHSSNPVNQMVYSIAQEWACRMQLMLLKDSDVKAAKPELQEALEKQFKAMADETFREVHVPSRLLLLQTHEEIKARAAKFLENYWEFGDKIGVAYEAEIAELKARHEQHHADKHARLAQKNAPQKLAIDMDAELARFPIKEGGEGALTAEYDAATGMMRNAYNAAIRVANRFHASLVTIAKQELAETPKPEGDLPEEHAAAEADMRSKRLGEAAAAAIQPEDTGKYGMPMVGFLKRHSADDVAPIEQAIQARIQHHRKQPAPRL